MLQIILHPLAYLDWKKQQQKRKLKIKQMSQKALRNLKNKTV